MEKKKAGRRVGRPRKKIKIVASHTIKKEEPKYERKWGNQFDKKYEDNDIEMLADEMLQFFITNKSAIHIVSFSTFKLIERRRLYEFATKNEYFKTCMDLVKDIIIKRFIEYGLAGKNAAFPIFSLINISDGEFKNQQSFRFSAEDPKSMIDMLSAAGKVLRNEV
jgi:hypothetical protein